MLQEKCIFPNVGGGGGWNSSIQLMEIQKSRFSMKILKKGVSKNKTGF